MTAILDKFITVWFFWMFVSFGLGIVGFIILFIRQFGKRKNKHLKVGIVLFAQTFLTWIIGFGTLWIIQSQARQELKEFLDQPGLVVTIDNEIVGQDLSVKLLNELKTISKADAHHSHPTEKLKMKIESKTDQISLSVERDSDYENEYWIYWDKYKVTRTNEIGRIRTHLFD